MKSFKELEPEIKILPEKKFIGKRMKISFSENRTYELRRNICFQNDGTQV